MDNATTTPIDQNATAVADTNPNSQRVVLDSPLRRTNGNDITEVQLLKPNAGALRGLSLTDLLQMNTVALQTILPRITQPQITKQDTANLDPADLVALGTALVGYLVPKAQRADFLTE